MRLNIDGLVQDCSSSIANALGSLQSCTRPSKCRHDGHIVQASKVQSDVINESDIWPWGLRWLSPHVWTGLVSLYRWLGARLVYLRHVNSGYTCKTFPVNQQCSCQSCGLSYLHMRIVHMITTSRPLWRHSNGDKWLSFVSEATLTNMVKFSRKSATKYDYNHKIWQKNSVHLIWNRVAICLSFDFIAA